MKGRREFFSKEPDIIIYSDASLVGWGFAFDGSAAQGPRREILAHPPSGVDGRLLGTPMFYRSFFAGICFALFGQQVLDRVVFQSLS